MTIENKKYYGSVSDYSSEKYSKNISIPNFESNSLDIKETNIEFSSSNLVKHPNLKYNFRTSSWNDINGNELYYVIIMLKVFINIQYQVLFILEPIYWKT